MVTRAAVVDEARRWLGTPFHHQAHTRGVGADCLGMVGGVAIALGLYPAEAWATIWAQHAGYARTPDGSTLEAVCRRYLVPAGHLMQPGDVLLMRFSRDPQHMAILVPYAHGGLAMVHAYSRAGRVVEHRYAPVWQARTVDWYSMPGVRD
jgi:NlpC/P60 family putative phage cell wall peptidase